VISLSPLPFGGDVGASLQALSLPCHHSRVHRMKSQGEPASPLCIYFQLLNLVNKSQAKLTPPWYLVIEKLG